MVKQIVFVGFFILITYQEIIHVLANIECSQCFYTGCSIHCNLCIVSYVTVQRQQFPLADRSKFWN